MKLKEFMKTDVYKNADCIEYVSNGIEIEYDDYLLNVRVTNHHKLSGFLEIELDVD